MAQSRSVLHVLSVYPPFNQQQQQRTGRLLLFSHCWLSPLQCNALCCSRAKKILDALEAVSDDSDASSSASEDAADEEAPQEQPAAKKQKTVTLEDLQKQGYNAGPSVLFMKPPEEAAQQNWNW